MRTLSVLIILLAVVFFSANTSRPDGDHGVREKVLDFMDRAEKRMLFRIDQLNAILYQENTEWDIDTMQQILEDARIAYKTLEPFVSYFFRVDQKYINGADVPEVEDEDDSNIPIPPRGLQVISRMLYDSIPQLHREAMKREIADLLKSIYEITEGLKISDINARTVLEACQFHLIRLFTLTCVQFETPDSKTGLSETACSLESMDSLLHECFPPPYDDRMKVMDVFHETIGGTTQFLRTHSYLDFDYFTLYSNWYIPLSDQLRTLRTHVVAPDVYRMSAVNLEAVSIFSRDAFRSEFFMTYYNDKNLDKKIHLGFLLFYDPVLSSNNKRSCASCHKPEAGFTDGLARSTAMNPSESVTRNAPSLLNSGFDRKLFRDGRSFTLERQASEVINNPVEMHGNFGEAAEKLLRSEEYVKLFNSAFGDDDDIQITEENIIASLATYERSLVSLNSPFDRAIRGNRQALKENEIRGFNLFTGKANCATCHFLPLFSGLVPPFYQSVDWEVIGVPATTDTIHPQIDPDQGRGGVYNTDLYRHAFKTTTVRNIALTAPYMHNGVYKTLQEVVDFYDKGGGRGLGIPIPNQTLQDKPLLLSEEEKSDLIAFMDALTDTAGLTAIPVSLPEFPKGDSLNLRKVGGEY